MAAGEYYVHNLSPFIFRVSELNFEWAKTPVGVVLIVAVIAALFVGLAWLHKRIARQGKNTAVISAVRMLAFFPVAGFLVLIGLNAANIEWGLRWYSTMYLLGFLYCYLCCRYWIAKRTIMLTQLQLDSLIAFLILGMIIGARVAYVFIYNWDSYSSNLSDVMKVWEGGLSFHGGIVGVVTAILLFCKLHKIPFFNLADKLCLTVPFGIGVGRIGNFMNGELYGRIISGDVPWAVIFSNTGGGPQPRHPSQIYQSLGEGFLLWGVLLLINRRKNHEGTISVAFIFFYGFFRFFMEYFREADEQLKYYLSNTTTMGQILCVVTMLVAVVIFSLTRNNVVEGTPEWRKRTDDYLAHQKELEA